MPIPIAVMLAMQAGGMIIDYMGKESQMDLAKQGAQLQQRAIEEAIQFSRLQAQDESAQAMTNLRKTLGSQIAMFAARGIRAGSPTQALVTNESMANFNADERIRRINELVTESKLRAGQQISSMHDKTFRSQISNEFTTSVINKIPTDPQAWEKIGESLGFGMTKAKGA